jgi:RimJ/RimL family protein N-acetyltransferase
LRRTDVFVDGSGLHRVDWTVPKFEIGYWVRKRFERQGYISEAVLGITQFAFEALGARRVEIRVDDRNVRSWRVPERLGFVLEGIMRNEARDVEGRLRDTRVYAKIRTDSMID